MSVRFSSLYQNFGQPKDFDESQLVYVEFMVAQGQTFDFTVDNVAFMP